MVISPIKFASLWTILIFLLCPVNSSPYPHDYLCNEGTKFACVCYVADGRLADHHPKCHAFLGVETLGTAQITLKSNDLVQKIKTSYGEETYEHYFKRRVVAYLLNAYCYKSRKDRCQNGPQIPVQQQDVVVLEIKCGEGKGSIIQYSVIKKENQNLLTQENTVDPNFVIEVLNRTLRRVPTLLGPAVLLHHEPSHYSIPKKLAIQRVVEPALHTADAHAPPEPDETYFWQNKNFFVALIVVGLLLILLYCVGTLKICYDRKKRRGQQANDAKQESEKRQAYGAIKKPETNSRPEFELKIQANSTASHEPFEKVLSNHFFPEVKLNYPQLAGRGPLDGYTDNNTTTEKPSKSGKIRKTVSDYILARIKHRGGHVTKSQTIADGCYCHFPPIDDERMEMAEKSGTAGVGLFGGKFTSKQKSASEKNFCDEKYPRTSKSKTFDKLMLEKLCNKEEILEEEAENFHSSEKTTEEAWTARNHTYTPGEVPEITIDEINEENNDEEDGHYALIPAHEGSKILPKKQQEMDEHDEKIQTHSEASSFHETDSESGLSQVDDDEWTGQSANLGGANYKQLVESSTSINRLDFHE